MYQACAESQKEIIRNLTAGMVAGSRLTKEVLEGFQKANSRDTKTLDRASRFAKNITESFRKLYPEISKEMVEKLIVELQCKEKK